MSRGLFVTGTGTDVGKTYVTSLMVKKLRESGINGGYYKAALSGAERCGGELVPGDAEYVCTTSGIRDNPASLVSYIYEKAVSPHLAAKLEGRYIEKAVIKADFKRVCEKFDYITAEGSGGIVCPLRRDKESIMLTDVINLLGLDIIIVTNSSLGSINSAVLTAHYAASHNIRTAGFVMNNYEKGNFLHEDNRREIEALTGVPVVALIAEGGREFSSDISTLKNLYKEIL